MQRVTYTITPKELKQGRLDQPGPAYYITWFMALGRGPLGYETVICNLTPDGKLRFFSSTGRLTEGELGCYEFGEEHSVAYFT